MPEFHSQPNLAVIGEEAYWTFEQALAFAIHLNVEKVGEKTPPFFALDDRSPEALKKT